ncbi:hypothetical protein BGW38_007909 [Lunasporangiospora selenospora]|uniref:AB hydrolase-1 domain-containing protein n=1 Tax=Lunasporangiospora selenospora TaxID=979761 RepID=A0A9P6G0E1_9FUNG|nr:hypothetical protein BGW38_007909 [Lunasporangiospora selenospora]
MCYYVEEGDPKGEPLLLVHGFPDIWYGWRYQIGYLAKLGYRVIAIDCLGYGQSDSPQDLQLYGMKSLCKQIVCILDELQIPKVTVRVCTPCNPPAPEYRSLEDIVKMVPEFEYQLNLAHPDTAAKMDKEDIKYIADQFVHSTFRGPLNYYKTTKINFDDERGLDELNVMLEDCLEDLLVKRRKTVVKSNL